MALVPGVTFEMGTKASEIPKLEEAFGIHMEELFSGEVPRHAVKLSSFYIDKHEVTNAEFKKFVDKYPKWSKGRLDPTFQNGKYLSDWAGNNFPKGKAKYPVIFINWYAAVAYCQSVGKRLPTEAEWEFAARGGLNDKAFPWGNEPADPSRANFSLSKIGAATRVGNYPPNGYGLYDMAGNVWEFLADEWSAYPASGQVLLDPVAGNDYFLTNSYKTIKTRRVIRGGSWGGAPVNLRVVYRDSHPPENAANHVGFRCAVRFK